MQSLKIPAADKARLKVMFLAKHAKASGEPHPEDGNHAIYHHEMRETLREIGLNLTVADTYDALCAKPDADYVVTLLNRGGFLNSEMLAPLMLTRHGIPFMGATPILRGLGDDKHLMKTVAQHRDVPVTPWLTVRRGQGAVPEPAFEWDKLVIKPNASSASWGVKITADWAEAKDHAEGILASGHDVIIEPFAPEVDVAVPVIGADGPWLLPTHAYVPPKDRASDLRSYEEKRALVPSESDEPLEPVGDPAAVALLEDYTRRLLPELWPFDYGRFEFRFDRATGNAKFMEVNLSCNLWSKKTISRAGRLLGLSHAQVVETILAHSMLRQGVIERVERAS